MSDAFRFSAVEIAALHDSALALWHENPDAAPDEFHPDGQSFLDTVLAQHRANFDLWHVEDRARTPGATDHDIAEVKRAIDRINQRRNDLAEQCDSLLLEQATAILHPKGGSDSTAQPGVSGGPPLVAGVIPLHSESPGLMIDRLSILALKLYHTREEIARPNAPAGHTERNRERMSLLEEQRSDLVACLDQLWSEVVAGTRRFKIYRQLKMYNDPTLNPSIYGSGST
ncbi:MAG TPA: DUF4254 domain-containing protein [Bryobacteraceae bacterium]